MKDKLSHQILKELVFKYKETDDQSVFCKILMRIDRLILYIINKFIAKRPQYRNIDFQELYNCAILGIYKGMKSAKEKETGAKLQARLIAYIKSEMSSFCNKYYERLDITKFQTSKSFIVSEEVVYHDFEMECLRERYQKFLDDEIISLEDWNLLLMRYVDEMKLTEIALTVHCHKDTVRRKLKNSLNRIRWELRRKNLEDI